MGLREYLADAGIETRTAEQLEALDALLVEWGRAVGLTGFRSVEERYRRYYLEPLRALPWVPEEGRALDIGSGGGSPGLPLAVSRPRLSWTLVESNERKARFLEVATKSLALKGVRIERARYETMAGIGGLDLVSCRGVKLSDAVLARVLGSLGSGGRFLWFSAKARLLEAAGSLPGREAWRVEGPIPLEREEPRSGWLLVIENRSCFT